MGFRPNTLDARLSALDNLLATLRTPGLAAGAIERWRADAAATRFHLRPPASAPTIVAILGGTGTGKSTLVNRLLGANVSATSFRRTFTSGPVAVARDEGAVPERWLGVDHVVVKPENLPASGDAGSLLVATHKHELTDAATIVDTPDLDGDQPAHHAQADRVFRWAQAVLFLVTPEKYQMTELLPYYRLAQRYGLPTLFVMNKCEEQPVVDDYARQLATHFGGVATSDFGELSRAVATVFVIPRDDAAYEPPANANLPSLRTALRELKPATDAARTEGLAHRASDLVGRLRDQILTPLSDQRRAADEAIRALRAMETPSPGIDVNPLTQQLQRRLQQRSVLYLMGPGRVLDRVRQVPSLLARLPRTAWDLVAGRPVSLEPDTAASTDGRHVPDFGAALADQFRVVQSRIDDVLRSSPAGERWVDADAASYASQKLDPANAGKIAEEELAELRGWLERRWNATPRDTALLMRLIKHLPGGERLTKLSEAAPYLLAIVVATHHAFFGHIDLMIIGGWSLFTWLTERLSNEVAARTRQANRQIAERFARLAHEQIRRTIEWVETQTPQHKSIDSLRRLSDALEEETQTTDEHR